VEGMHCASCASTIKRKLEKLDGIETCTVNYGTEKAKVGFDPQKVSISQMNKEVKKLGYTLSSSSEDHPGNHAQMSHSLHEGHDMMTPITSDKTVKERKLQELA